MVYMEQPARKLLEKKAALTLCSFAPTKHIFESTKKCAAFFFMNKDSIKMASSIFLAQKSAAFIYHTIGYVPNFIV